MDVRALEKLLYNQSGLLGVSGISSDVASCLKQDPRQARSRRLYVYRIDSRTRLTRCCLGRSGRHRLYCGRGENSAKIREEGLSAMQHGWAYSWTQPLIRRAHHHERAGSVTAWVVP